MASGQKKRNLAATAPGTVGTPPNHKKPRPNSVAVKRETERKDEPMTPSVHRNQESKSSRLDDQQDPPPSARVPRLGPQAGQSVPAPTGQYNVDNATEARPDKHLQNPNFRHYKSPKQLLEPCKANKSEIFIHMKTIGTIAEASIDDIPAHHDFSLHVALPRLRNIERNPRYRSSEVFATKYKTNFVSLAVYLTGEEPPVPCDKCAKGSGPFVGCVMVHSSVKDEAYIKSCANCIYGWQAAKCSLHTPRADQGSAVPGPKGKIETATNKDNHASEDDANSTAAEHSSVRQEDQAICDEPRPLSNGQRESFQSSRADPITRNVSADGNSGPSTPQVAPRPLMYSAMFARSAGAPQPSSGMSHLNARTTSVQIEDWEHNGGILTTSNGDDYPIAFSAAALDWPQAPTRAHRGVALRSSVVRAASSRTWGPTTDQTRLCVVSGARLHVQLDGEEFFCGPNGVFRVRPGRECVLENRSVADATVVVVQLDEF